MANNVDDHEELEEEHICGVQVRQYYQQAHVGSTVSQHVQHCTKLGTCQAKQQHLVNPYQAVQE